MAPFVPKEKRPIMTHEVMHSLIRLRLRDNEGPRHIDSLTAARDFYENAISRDYVFKAHADAESKMLTDVLKELWAQIEESKRTPDLERKVNDALSHGSKPISSRCQ